MVDIRKSSHNAENILIVEDSPTQLEKLRFLLEESGFTVVTATNGREGLAAASVNEIDLVISDIMMPEMDGYELCKALRADEKFLHIPVILLTSLSDPRDVIKGLESGANNFICKPYEDRALMARIQNVLANQEIRKESSAEMGISIFFAGQRFFVTADRLQILDLLLSTYENAVTQNEELLRTRNELRNLNEDLEQKVRERTTELSSEIAVRRLCEERERHLNLVLRSIRNVNQLIVREKDPDQLIQQACDLLIESRGYRAVWIGLTPENGQPLKFAQAGWGEEFGPFAEKLRDGDSPPCWEKARAAEKGVLELNPRQSCRECTLWQSYGQDDAIVAPLRHGSQEFGMLGICIAQGAMVDEDELSLLIEVAGDLGLALHGIATEKQRHQGEQKYRRLFEAARDGILILDADTGQVVDVNPFLVELLGYSHENFLNKYIWELGSFANIVKSKEAFSELKEKEYVRYEDQPLVTSDGRRIAVEFVSNVYLVENERVIQCNIRDISKRKQTAEELTQERNLLRTLIDNLPDYIFVKDTESRIVINNASHRHVLNVDTLENAVGKTDADFFPRELAASYRKDEVEIIRSGTPLINREEPLIGADGGQRWLLTTKVPLRNNSGEISGIVGIGRDITERKLAEDELRFLNLILTNQQEATIDGILVVDVKGRIISSNRRFAEMWSIPLDIIESKSDEAALQSVMDRLVNPEEFIRKVQHLYSNPDETSQDEIDLKDGSTFDRYSVPMIGTDGTNFGRVWYFRDITDRKQAEEDKEKLQKRLLQSQKMEAIGTLAGGIAHDFNNILSAIIGYSELSIPETAEGSQVRSDLGKILQAGNRAKGVVNQILTFSRQREEGKSPLSIAPIVKEVMKLLQASLPSTILIKTDIKSNIGSVIADPSQIHQIIMNLCTNAAHAMKKSGGTLTVKLDEITIDDTFISMNPKAVKGRYVRLIVCDTGHGMTGEIMGRIFEPYYTTKNTGEGSGLGLSIVHGIVESIQGTINVYSEPEKGSTFKVYLPVTDQETTPGIDNKKTVYTGQGRILFVDDEPAIVEIGARILKSLGYEVTTMTSSVDALDFFQKNHAAIDLVISDMTMPFIPGDELARDILEIRPDMPIIICTGHSDRMSEEEAKILGIRHYLSKPLLKSEIAEKVHSILAQ